MSLRRVAKPTPLDLLERDLQTTDEDLADIFSVVVISPCQIWISNDPPPDGEFQDPNPCNITSFECFDRVANAASGVPGPTHVEVSFDYEVYYDETADLDRTIGALESNMLQHLAGVFDLLECPLASTSRRSGNRGLEIFSEELADLFVGVDSTPVDDTDPAHDECIVPVSSTVRTDAVCQPMIGYFSAEVNADLSATPTAEASIRSGLLRLIRLGMQEDLYSGGTIRKVSFIGDRTTFVAPPPTTTSTTTASTDKGLGPVALSFVLIAAILAFLIGGLLVGNHLRKKKQHDERGIILEDHHYISDDEAGEQAWNKGHVAGRSVLERADSAEPGSLAEQDELALEPQDLVAPVLSKSAEQTDDATDDAIDVSVAESPTRATREATSLTVDTQETDKPAPSEADASLAAFMATSTTASDVPTEADAPSRAAAAPKTPSPKKRKKKKKKKVVDTSSPDSLRDALSTLDSIAEEPHDPNAVIDGSDDSSGPRSLS